MHRGGARAGKGRFWSDDTPSALQSCQMFLALQLALAGPRSTLGGRTN